MKNVLWSLLCFFCFQAAGQKFNVISVSPPIGKGTLVYPKEPNSKDLYNRSLQIVIEDTLALVINQERNDQLQFDFIKMYKWQVALDLFLLDIVAINPTNAPLLFTPEDVNTGYGLPSLKLTSSERSYELGDTLRIPDLQSSFRPKPHLGATKTDLLFDLNGLEKNDRENDEFLAPSMPTGTSEISGEVDSVEKSNDPKNDFPFIDLGYSGHQKRENPCLVQGGNNDPLRSLKISKEEGTYTLKVILETNKYYYQFNDTIDEFSSLSEFQADVNSKGELVFIRRLFDENGTFISSEIIHVNEQGEKINQIKSRYDLDRETVLLDFENDSTVLIKGLIKDRKTLIYFGRYNTNTQVLQTEINELPKASFIGPNPSPEKNMTHQMVDNILGYKSCKNGYYLLFGTDHRIGTMAFFVNSKDIDFQSLMMPQKKQETVRLTSRKQGIYVVKISMTGSPEWVNGLNFREAIIGGVGMGNDFPIFLTDHRKSDFAGIPYVAMVTTKGIQYLEPVYELIQEGYGMLTGIVHLDGSEYLGIVTTFPYLSISRTSYNHPPISNLSFSYSVIRFEVYD